MIRNLLILFVVMFFALNIVRAGNTPDVLLENQRLLEGDNDAGKPNRVDNITAPAKGDDGKPAKPENRDSKNKGKKTENEKKRRKCTIKYKECKERCRIKNSDPMDRYHCEEKCTREYIGCIEQSADGCDGPNCVEGGDDDGDCDGPNCAKQKKSIDNKDKNSSLGNPVPDINIRYPAPPPRREEDTDGKAEPSV